MAIIVNGKKVKAPPLESPEDILKAFPEEIPEALPEVKPYVPPPPTEAITIENINKIAQGGIGFEIAADDIYDTYQSYLPEDFTVLVSSGAGSYRVAPSSETYAGIAAQLRYIIENAPARALVLFIEQVGEKKVTDILNLWQGAAPTTLGQYADTVFKTFEDYGLLPPEEQFVAAQKMGIVPSDVTYVPGEELGEGSPEAWEEYYRLREVYDAAKAEYERTLTLPTHHPVYDKERIEAKKAFDKAKAEFDVIKESLEEISTMWGYQELGAPEVAGGEAPPEEIPAELSEADKATQTELDRLIEMIGQDPKLWRAQAQINIQAFEKSLQFVSGVQKVFPDADVEQMLDYLETDQVGFLNDIRAVGWTYHAEMLLRQMFPTITGNDLGVIFKEPVSQVFEMKNEETGDFDTYVLRDDGSLWVGGECAGTIDENGEFWPHKEWYEKIFAPFQWVGERIARTGPALGEDFRQSQYRRITLDVSNGRTDNYDELTYWEKQEFAIVYSFGTNPELSIAFNELPWYVQLACELPAWVMTGTVSVQALRNAIIKAGATGTIPETVASVSKWVLLPPATVETGIAAGLKYGVVLPAKLVVKGISTTAVKAFELALDAGLEKWIFKYTTNPQLGNKLIKWVLERHDYWFYNQALRNLAKRRASGLGEKQAAEMAAADTIQQAEAFLLQAGREVGAIKVAPTPAPKVPVPKVEPLKPPPAAVTPVKPEVPPAAAPVNVELIGMLKRIEAGETLTSNELLRIKKLSPELSRDIELAGREFAEIEEVNTAIEKVLTPEELTTYKRLFYDKGDQASVSAANKIAHDALVKEGWLFDLQSGQWYKPIVPKDREAMLEALRTDLEDIAYPAAPEVTPADAAEIAKTTEIQSQNIVKEQLSDVQLELWEAEQQIAGLKEWMASDEIANYRGNLGKRSISLMYFFKGRDWPEFVTVKEAEFLLSGRPVAPSSIRTTAPGKGKVPMDYVLPEMAEVFNMTSDQLVTHLKRITQSQVRIESLEKAMLEMGSREAAISQTLRDMKVAIPKSKYAPSVKPPAAESLLTKAVAVPDSIGAMKDELAEAMFKLSGGRGFYKDVASLRQSLDGLTDSQIRGLYKTHVEGLKIGETELEKSRAIADRTGLPWGSIKNAPAYKAVEDIKAALFKEQFTPIKDSPLDIAATSFWKNGNFEEFVKLYPSYSELKLKTLTDDVFKNITELEELVTYTSKQITEIEGSLANNRLSKVNVKEAYTEIRNLKRDISFTNKLMKDLRVGKQMTVDDAVALGIAVRETKGGNLVPAIRKSGFYANEEFVKSPYLRNVGYRSGRWQDTISMHRSIDFGHHATLADDYIGMTQKYINWPTQRTWHASQRFAQESKALIHGAFEKYKLLRIPKYQMRDLYELVQEVSTVKVGIPAEDLLKTSEIASLVKKYSPDVQRNMVEFSQWSRTFLDDMLRKVNRIRERRAQEPIKYRRNYLTWMSETSVWSKLGHGQRSPSDLFRKPPLPDYIIPDSPFNATAMAREGGMENMLRETNVYKILFRYTDTVTKDIFYTAIIHNAKIHVAALRARGFYNSARLIEDWAAESYAGVTPQLTKGVEGVVPAQVLKGAYIMRRNLTRAVFPLNWKWNLTIQPSSLALSVLRFGIVNNVRGLDFLFSNSAKAYVKNRYSYTVKQSRRGKMAYQDIGAQVTGNLKWEGSLLDKAENAGNALTNFIEEKLTGISIRAAYYRGQQLGFKGRALEEYASNGGALTQSMYNYEDVTALGRLKPLTTLFPFQTFMFQAFNTIREMNIIGLGRAGAYETMSAKTAKGKATISNRLSMLLQFIATIWAINIVVDNATGRKPWVMHSFIPFYSVLTGGTDATNPWQWPLPMQYVAEFWKAFESVIKYDNWDKMRKWTVRYHTLGGTQINRMIDGMIALLHGEVTDVRGKTMFEVGSDEWLAILMLGPYGSEEGSEYIDKIKESKGEWYEWFGVPWPERLEPDDAIEEELAKLGELRSEDPDDIYNFGHFVSAIRDFRRIMGEGRFLGEDNEFILQFLEAESSKEELEKVLDGVPDDERADVRDEWRRTHPEDDARLALFAHTGRIQSMEAYELVVKWAESLGISMEHLDTWLPPEEIAGDYFGYIDLIREFTGGSNEAILFRMEHPEFDEWGQMVYDWEDIPETKHIESARISVKWAELDEKYEAAMTDEERDKILSENPEYADDRRRRDAYNYELEDKYIETYVEYFHVIEDPDKGTYDDEWYKMHNWDFYLAVVDTGAWKGTEDFTKVPTSDVYDLWLEYDALRKPNGNADTKKRREFREEHPILDAWGSVAKNWKPRSDISEFTKDQFLEWYKLGLDKITPPPKTEPPEVPEMT